jgi:hypothetical protein
MLATIVSSLLILAVLGEDDVPSIYDTTQADPVETLPQIELLYVYDIISHGSTYPETNVTGLEREYDAKKMGKLSPFGERQMYLRGKEMRRRLIH